MHILAISKMKIELPWRSVPPPLSRGCWSGRCAPDVDDLHVVAGGRVRARAPAAQHMLDAGIGAVRVVGGMRVVHGDDVGTAGGFT